MTISIITINRNNAAGLAETMVSVLMQDYPALEYIVIDGGSTDGSAAQIALLAHRLAYWVSEPDRGIYHAQNKGLARATGDYILFLNSGDVLAAPDVLSALAAQTGPGRDLVYGNLWIQPADAPAWLKTYPPAAGKDYLRYDTLPHCGTLIRTQLLKEAGGYDETLRIVSDWKFFAEAILKKHAGCRHIDKAIARFAYDGLSSLPENRALLEQEMKTVWDAMFPPPGPARRLMQRLVRKFFPTAGRKLPGHSKKC